jgi:hypothetical protein
MFSPNVQSALESLVSALRAELRMEFLSVLGGGDIPTPFRKRGPGRPKGASKARPKGGKRTPQQLDQLVATVLNFIRKNPGSRSEQIAEGLGVSTKELVLPINKLFDAKVIKSTGQRRGMKYSAR